MHAFQVQAQAISSKDQKIIIKVQAYQVPRILNGPRRSKWPNFASLHIRFAISWLSLKFACSLFLCFFDSKVSCGIIYTFFTCVYIQKKKKKSRFPNLSKKREKFSIKKKNLWNRGIELSSDFFKKAQFFSFKDFKIKKKKKKKVSFSKWYMRIPWTIFFLNLDV